MKLAAANNKEEKKTLTLLIDEGEDINKWAPEESSLKAIPTFRTLQISIEALELWLQNEYPIKKNIITRSYELHGIELETEDWNSIFIAAKKKFEKLQRELFDTLLFSNFTPSYNPIKDYFQSFNWDKKDRINSLCQCINSDTGDFNYRLSLLQSWLLGIIESIYNGEPNVLQLILAGKQNTGKSYFFKNLLPSKLLKYFGLSQLDKGKDDELLMCQLLMILDDEYSGKSKQDAKHLKRLQSAPSFNLRPPYGKKNEKLKRIATLCGTSNETQLLNDLTGNRRNIIFEIIGKFNFNLYNGISKDQLFAQLVSLHKQGVKAALSDSLIDQIQQHTEGKHSEVSIEAECIKNLFEPPAAADKFNFMNATAVKVIIEKATGQKLNIGKLGKELTRLKYTKVQVKNIGSGYLILQKTL